MAVELQAKGLTLDSFKAMNYRQGFLLYTTAKMEDRSLSSSDPISVDQVLMNLSYVIDHAADEPGVMVLADREVEDRTEAVRYHPLGEGDPERVKLLNMRTRVNFFGPGPTDAVYDVAKAFLDKGYEVALPPLNRVFDRFHWLRPGENGNHTLDTITLR